MATPDDAHDELQEIAYLIVSLPELAKKADLPEANHCTVADVTEKLIDVFRNLDQTVHGGGDVCVEKLSQQITAEVGKLMRFSSEEVRLKGNESNG